MGQGNACFHFAPLALFRLRLHLAHVESAHNNAHTRDQTQPTAYYDMDNETLLYNFLKSQHYYEQAQATVLAIDCREMCVFIRSCMVLTHTAIGCFVRLATFLRAKSASSARLWRLMT